MADLGALASRPFSPGACSTPGDSTGHPNIWLAACYVLIAHVTAARCARDGSADRARAVLTERVGGADQRLCALRLISNLCAENVPAREEAATASGLDPERVFVLELTSSVWACVLTLALSRVRCRLDKEVVLTVWGLQCCKR
eukprot:1861095-Rhodomonas_salina.4